MTTEEYADKVETFIGLWRENLISDFELIENVHSLSSNIADACNLDFVHEQFNRVKASEQQDGLQDTGHIDAGPYWHG